MEFEELFEKLKDNDYEGHRVTSWGDWGSRLVIKTDKLPMCITVERVRGVLKLVVFRYRGRVGQESKHTLPSGKFTPGEFGSLIAQYWVDINPHLDGVITSEIKRVFSNLNTEHKQEELFTKEYNGENYA